MDDINALQHDILQLARQGNLKITCAESCTGGMVAAALTDLPGASEIFEQGFVTYSNAAKAKMLNVPDEIIRNFGAVSEECAQAMATGARHVAQADIAVAITGIAGPGGSTTKPEGRVCFAIAIDGNCHSETKDFGSIGRNANRIKARKRALNLLLKEIKSIKN